jgi:hypothetical protein
MTVVPARRLGGQERTHLLSGREHGRGRPELGAHVGDHVSVHCGQTVETLAEVGQGLIDLQADPLTGLGSSFDQVGLDEALGQRARHSYGRTRAPWPETSGDTFAGGRAG